MLETELDYWIDDCIQIGVLATCIFLFFFIYGTQIQVQILYREVDAVLEYTLKPTSVWLLDSQKRELLERIAGLGPFPEGMDPETEKLNQEVIQNASLSVAGILGVCIISSVILAKWNRRGFPVYAVGKTLYLAVVVLGVEYLFVTYVIGAYRPLDYRRLADTFLTSLIQRWDTPSLPFPIPALPGYPVVPFP